VTMTVTAAKRPTLPEGGDWECFYQLRPTGTWIVPIYLMVSSYEQATQVLRVTDDLDDWHAQLVAIGAGRNGQSTEKENYLWGGADQTDGGPCRPKVPDRPQVASGPGSGRFGGAL